MLAAGMGWKLFGLEGEGALLFNFNGVLPENETVKKCIFFFFFFFFLHISVTYYVSVT